MGRDLVISLTTCPNALLKEFKVPKNLARSLTGTIDRDLICSNSKKNDSNLVPGISYSIVMELTKSPRKIFLSNMGLCFEMLTNQPHFVSTKIRKFLFFSAIASG